MVESLVWEKGRYLVVSFDVRTALHDFHMDVRPGFRRQWDGKELGINE